MKTCDDILLKAKMIEHGIVPYDFNFSGYKLQDALKTFDSVNRRVATRKFRRLWRRIVKSFKQIPDVYGDMKCSSGMGLHENELTHQHRTYRAYLVYSQFLENIRQDAKNIREKN